MVDVVRININNGTTKSDGNEFKYEYGRWKLKNCDLPADECSKCRNKVCRDYSVHLAFDENNISIYIFDKNKDFEKYIDFGTASNNKTNLFKDVYRKSLLLHVFLFDYVPKVEKITFESGTSKEDVLRGDYFFDAVDFVSNGDELVIDKNDEKYGSAFPFVFLQAGEGKLMLDSKWRSDRFILANLDNKKTGWSKDLRIPTVFSFLRSTSVEVESTRFVYLWISMNAYYSYFAKQYEMASKIYANPFANDGQGMKRIKAYSFDNDESRMLNYFIRHLNIKADKKDSSFVKNQMNEDGFNNIYFSAGKYIGQLADLNLEEIYTRFQDKNVSEDDFDDENIKKLFEISRESFGLRPFEFLLVEYAYYLRNITFHAKLPSMLFLENEAYEDKIYKVINYFLHRYLNEHIPELVIGNSEECSEEGIISAGEYEIQSYIVEIQTKAFDIYNKRKELKRISNDVNKKKTVDSLEKSICRTEKEIAGLQADYLSQKGLLL